MEYIKKDDLQNIIVELQNELNNSEGNICCFDKIKKIVNTPDKIKVANIQYLDDATKALDAAIKTRELDANLIGWNAENYSFCYGKMTISRLMKREKFKVTRQTIAKWEEAARLLGYLKPLSPYGDKNINIRELSQYLHRISSDKRRGF